ncbi:MULTISPECIES: hypothetical protein [unclassified Mesorhizobium]|uniref:hypothetical protein n=1 Tax=unclassified Mesorhizobium TaxID=325217 RepID=UPI001FE006AF|nr:MULTISPECIES: hypothetical protein [unclassified Mesorhizobium]
MTHSTAVLFAHVGTWLLRLPAADKRLEDGRPEGEAKSPTPVFSQASATACRRVTKVFTRPGSTGRSDRSDNPPASGVSVKR